MYRNLNGMRTMSRLPECLVVIDPKKERNAVQEAQKLGIATVALIDTDSDPDVVDLPIPGNDDSIRSIELIVNKASWAEAERALAKAVEYRPEYVYHRLDLAEVYVDQKKHTQAESQLRAIADLPLSDVMDPQYKRDAAALLARLPAGSAK